MKTLTTAILAIMLSSTSAFAWSRDFKFINNTHLVVDHIAFKNSHSKWDVSRDTRTEGGFDRTIRFDGPGSCVLDLKVSFDARRLSAVFIGLNFCGIRNVILQENSDGSVYVDYNNDKPNGKPDDEEAGKDYQGD